jgi:N-formylglutamate amidohydrolase
MKLPLVTSAPHNSDNFHDFSDRVILDPWYIGEFTDMYTADTAYHPDALGNLKALAIRGLGSLNQPRDKTLFKLKDFHGNTIWKKRQELTEDEKEYCFKTYWDPYHKEIQHLIKESKRLGFDKVLLWDHHDTGDFDKRTGKRDRKLPGENRTMPKFILSNAEYACPPEFVKNIQTFMAKEFGLKTSEVEINTSYKGGFIMQHYGNPKNFYGNEVVGIQIEYNRGFIMDQATREPYWDVIKDFNKKFNVVMEKACRLI